jgi:hypothetical protein
MQARLVLSEGQWISVPLPKGRDPTWTVAEEYGYAAAYASAIRCQFTEKRAQNVAEACVIRRLYPGIRFDKAIEQDIQSIIPE